MILAHVDSDYNEHDPRNPGCSLEGQPIPQRINTAPIGGGRSVRPKRRITDFMDIK